MLRVRTARGQRLPLLSVVLVLTVTVPIQAQQPTSLPIRSIADVSRLASISTRNNSVTGMAC